MSGVLQGKVCIVTGATRGIGKGISLQLGEAGATVYITGRTLTPKAEGVGGSLQETVQEIESRGGRCIPVRCDHGNDDEIKKLFEKVKDEQNGRLDILVNNAYSGVPAISKSMAAKQKFWQEEIDMWDAVNGVGLRSHYIASVYAAQLMVPAKQGLIVNISSAGGLVHIANPLYGIGKTGCDRMAVECAIDLKQHNVACVSLWPGAVRTEHVKQLLTKPTGGFVSQNRHLFEHGETPEFSGKVIVHLATDPNIMKKSGKIIHTTWVANEFGFLDVDGKHPMNPYSFKYRLTISGHSWLAAVVPEYLGFPMWMVAAKAHKF